MRNTLNITKVSSQKGYRSFGVKNEKNQLELLPTIIIIDRRLSNVTALSFSTFTGDNKCLVQCGEPLLLNITYRNAPPFLQKNISLCVRYSIQSC